MSNLNTEHDPRKATLEQVVEFLSDLEPGRQDYNLFLQIARLSVLPCIEMVPLKQDSDGNAQVLLTKRPKGDLWEDMWHIPGAVMLPTDKAAHGRDYDGPISRVLGKGGELEGLVNIGGDPVEVETERRKTLRGDEIAVIFYVPVEGEVNTDDARFFDVEGLPNNVPRPGAITHQISFVKRATERYLNDLNAN